MAERSPGAAGGRDPPVVDASELVGRADTNAIFPGVVERPSTDA
jgi:hypothetical protein